jgi:2-amino-4-hydroxy-6-hydroxymethyldihydropteridine diphosphokinase
MTRAFILAGTNLGDRKANLEFARKSLADRAIVVRFSSCFETEPVGYWDQPWFLNQAIELETELSPHDLLLFCQSIEASCGRVRSFPNAPRTLDLDILLFGDAVISDKDLVVPHPRLHKRRFALEPLAQISPDTIHPLLKKSIRRLLDECPDSSRVHPADERDL